MRAIWESAWGRWTTFGGRIVIRRAYRQQGVAGLRPGKPPGLTSRATPEYRAALRNALETSPHERGYGFSVWSLARLNAHLKELTHISFSEDQLGRIVHAEGFSFQRPKHTLKGKRDEAAYERAAAKRKTLKKALRDDADEVLIYQDEMEIHRHPTLTWRWAPVGQQPEVSAPGQNEKKVVYGGVEYNPGKRTYTIADTKCGAEFLAFLIVLLAEYAGRKIRLVCDNGRFHTTQPVQAWLAEHREQIEIFGLPPYSPSLNLIERLWGHVKRTLLANVLFETLDDLVAAFRTGVQRLTSHRDRMTFLFDHDDLPRQTPHKSLRIAA